VSASQSTTPSVSGPSPLRKSWTIASTASDDGFVTEMVPVTRKSWSTTVSVTSIVQVQPSVSPRKPDCASGVTVLATLQSCRSTYVAVAVLLTVGM